MIIDWSKAQEGTTHAFTDEDRGSVQWRKKVGDQWFAYTKTYGWEEIVGRPEVYTARPDIEASSTIRRGQAEALLKLAEALEECERNGLGMDFEQGNIVVGGEYHELADLTSIAVRFATVELYPKSEAAE